jgi:4-aminobutyrate aminotransferase
MRYVEPDIVCIAKGIASVVPLGAVVVRISVMTWPRGTHTNTYGGNPLACAAALASIRLIRHGLMQNTARHGAFLRGSLATMQPRHPIIDQPDVKVGIRCCGRL